MLPMVVSPFHLFDIPMPAQSALTILTHSTPHKGSWKSPMHPRYARIMAEEFRRCAPLMEMSAFAFSLTAAGSAPSVSTTASMVDIGPTDIIRTITRGFNLGRYSAYDGTMDQTIGTTEHTPG